ncbi:beta-tubulin [Cryptosporidium ryanae]|uniref:beta-tubulin n=1 Tax=Cryptosporidium ryanae TaxID=515981 RepID=UPI003519F1F0|nr:beta-tubulin [Cryptosporidium ryanae]
MLRVDDASSSSRSIFEDLSCEKRNFSCQSLGRDGEDSKKNSSRIIVNSGSVIGLKYKDGIMMMASPLLCYGSLKMFSDVSRFHVVGSGIVDLHKEDLKIRSEDAEMSSVQNYKKPLVNKLSQINEEEKIRFYENKFTLMASTGEFSDFQSIVEKVEEKSCEDLFFNTNCRYAKEYSCFISSVHYQRRNKMDPLLNDIVIGGVRNDGTKELYSIDHFGTRFQDEFVASGLSEYLGITLLRDRYRPDMTFDEAKNMLEDCMRNSFYVECKGSRMVQMATINSDGTRIYPKYPLEVTWRYNLYTKSDINRKDYVGF